MSKLLNKLFKKSDNINKILLGMQEEKINHVDKQTQLSIRNHIVGGF